MEQSRNCCTFGPTWYILLEQAGIRTYMKNKSIFVHQSLSEIPMYELTIRHTLLDLSYYGTSTPDDGHGWRLRPLKNIQTSIFKLGLVPQVCFGLSLGQFST